jgi:hypothetical protein
MRGPEGRLPNVSPARKGWGINPEEDPSAVGAALCHPGVAESLPRAKSNRDLQFRRPVLEMFFDEVRMQVEVKVCRAYGARTMLGNRCPSPAGLG